MLTSFHVESAKPKPRQWKKPMLIGALACAIVLPTAAWAGPSLADEVYGSYEVVKKKAITFTLQQYTAFGMKLAGAQGSLGKDFSQFIKLVKQITAAKVEYGDSTGNIDYDKLTKEQYDNLYKVHYEIQPFFDRLNKLPSSKEILTKAEYTTFINALLVYQSLLVQAGIDPSKGRVNADQLPVELREEFASAQKVIRDVGDRQSKLRDE